MKGTTKKTPRYASAGRIIRYGAILLRCRLLVAAPAIGSAAGDGGVEPVELLRLLVGEVGPGLQLVEACLRRVDQRVGCQLRVDLVEFVSHVRQHGHVLGERN